MLLSNELKNEQVYFYRLNTNGCQAKNKIVYQQISIGVLSLTENSKPKGEEVSGFHGSCKVSIKGCVLEKREEVEKSNGALLSPVSLKTYCMTEHSAEIFKHIYLWTTSSSVREPSLLLPKSSSTVPSMSTSSSALTEPVDEIKLNIDLRV